ncbi:Dabb family protein [Flammeovirga agarivorans]|uniref:Dabb family protein n=1 Tax=Flammeovirga agarivorans TaxID=2726742 RepID=A0A7X8XV94_9BACT|nr:Dabb family protein [Flammeovirga agarivorans]NLR90860.1 Dabb family protein [Flammeovirga agarivorans]
MYKHIVLWKLQEEAQGNSKSVNAGLVKEKVEGLKQFIPEIEDLDVGINIGDYGASFFDVGMYITFQSKEDFLKYITYKEHDEVVTFIQSVMSAEEIVDFES